MSNMPNWLVPEDDRSIPTGALWRQCNCGRKIIKSIYKIYKQHLKLIVKQVFKDVIMNVSDKWCVSYCQYSVCNTQKYFYICYSQCVKPVIWLNVQSFGQMPLTASHLAKCLKFPVIWPNDWQWVPSVWQIAW